MLRENIYAVISDYRRSTTPLETTRSERQQWHPKWFATDASFEAAHQATGLQLMMRRLRRAGVTRVAIERGDGPVVDALLAGGLQVVVVSSRQVKALRLRYGTAGNKDDRFDAFVLADVLVS